MLFEPRLLISFCNVPIYCNISNDGYKKRKGVWPAQGTIGKLNCKKRHRFNLNTGKRKKNKQKQKSQQERREGRTLAWGIFKLPVSHLIKISISLWSYFLTFTFLIFSWMWHIDFMFSTQTQQDEKLDPVGSTVRYELMKLCAGSIKDSNSWDLVVLIKYKACMPLYNEKVKIWSGDTDP